MYQRKEPEVEQQVRQKYAQKIEQCEQNLEILKRQVRSTKTRS